MAAHRIPSELKVAARFPHKLLNGRDLLGVVPLTSRLTGSAYSGTLAGSMCPNGLRRARFGVFNIDLVAREIRKHGTLIRLQDQPFEVLCALIERPGELVTRQDLRNRIWLNDTFVDFDQSLNKAVNKIREALGDSASRPIYIETLARRGYRFIAPVDGDRVDGDLMMKPSTSAKAGASRRRVALRLAAGASVLTMIFATGLWPIEVPQVERVVSLTNDSTFKVRTGRLVADGNRVLYSDGNDVWWVPASGGEPNRLSLPFLKNASIKVLADYSRIRQQILLSSPYTGISGSNELWLAGTEGEAPRKIAELTPPSRAALAPDAERIAFSTPDGIYIQSIKDGGRTKVHTMTGMSLTLPWWHPSGSIIGFVDRPDDLQNARTWQVNADGTHRRRIVPEREHGQGAGAWSQDGKRFFYSGIDGEIFVRIQAGILGWLRQPVVSRLTASGQFRTPPAVDPVNPKRLYAVGSIVRGETMRYDRKAQRWVSFLSGFSGSKLDRSPDGQWLAYVKFPESELHKCRTDGSNDVLLAPGLEAVNPSWSPDGKQIAFSGRRAGTTTNFKLWLVSAGGGDTAIYTPEIDSGFDTIWSGDGRRILLGQQESGHSGIRILDLKTGEQESITGTERLFSPRWSPDEKQILALELGTMRPRILDCLKGEWRPLAEESIGYPKWSRDGKYIYAADFGPIGEAIRLEVGTGRREAIAPVDFKAIDWLGWTEDWEPLTIRDLSSTQVYRIDLDR
jgi:DNA-binding winged helix-turn-helix (wHTH) protein/Tol biopolymer transport system component